MLTMESSARNTRIFRFSLLVLLLLFRPSAVGEHVSEETMVYKRGLLKRSPAFGRCKHGAKGQGVMRLGADRGLPRHQAPLVPT